MSRLRDPECGCPWDLEQSYATIVASTIEEAYEVADAIEREDLKHLPEELGDLLFQVIFYSQLGKEDGRFDFDQVVDTLVAKLIRRHPHVFTDGTLCGQGARVQVNTETKTAQVSQTWEQIKAQERDEKGLRSILDDVPTGLPALTRAQKLQHRLAKTGWDWQAIEPMLAKLDEERLELNEALLVASAAGLDPKDCPDVAAELGDVLFMAVNIARFLKMDAETCLRASSRKFESRVRFIESTLAERGQAIGEGDEDQLEALWQQAKSFEKSGPL